MSLIELARRKDPSGNLMVITEVLNEDNPIIQDAPWMEANDTFSHRVNRRSYVPPGEWRKLNAGVGIAATRTRVVTSGIGMLETFSEQDVDLIKSFPNPSRARMDEASGFIEGMGQHLAATVIYGNTAATPEEINGFSTHMSALNATNNVRGAGGSGGDTTSIYIVQWGLGKVYMVYPKGDPQLGIMHEDLGIQRVSTSTTARFNAATYMAYVDHFQAKVGLVVQDERCIARLANIESTGTSNIFDEDDLITLLNRMPKMGAGAVLYANDTIITQMEIALKDKNNVNYTAGGGDGLSGEPVVRFRGHPVKKVDQILNTETVVA